jgi:hypothetical protein
VSPHRTQMATDSVAVFGVAVTVSLGVIADHFLGVVDVIAILALLLWLVDMAGGTTRAMVRGYRGEVAPDDPSHPPRYGVRGAVGALRGDRAIEGFGKLFGMALAVIVLGAFEIIQVHATEGRFEGGVYVPLVAPALLVAAVFLGASIVDQIGFFWDAFGKRVRKIFQEGLPEMPGKAGGSEDGHEGR